MQHLWVARCILGKMVRKGSSYDLLLGDKTIGYISSIRIKYDLS